MNLLTNLTVDPTYRDVAITDLTPMIINEAVRKYKNRDGVEVEQPIITVQGITSEPMWNHFGQNNGSYHFKIFTFDPETNEDIAFPVNVFGVELASLVAAKLDFRQMFIRLKGDLRTSAFTATRGPRQGREIASTSIAVNFTNQINMLAQFQPIVNPWFRETTRLSKAQAMPVDELPFG
jgi:hypothetical protein